MSSIPLTGVRLRDAIHDGKRNHSFLRVDKQERFAPVEITLRPDLLCILVQWPGGKMTLTPLTNVKDAVPGVTLKRLEAAVGLLGEKAAVMPPELEDEEETPPPPASPQKKKRGRPKKVK
jgi:hypothetical protein